MVAMQRDFQGVAIPWRCSPSSQPSPNRWRTRIGSDRLAAGEIHGERLREARHLAGKHPAVPPFAITASSAALLIASHCAPSLPRLAERVDREIGRGAVGIGMREPAGDLALAASGLKDRVPGRGLDRVVSKRSHVIEVSNQAPLSNPTSCQPWSALPKADHP